MSGIYEILSGLYWDFFHEKGFTPLRALAFMSLIPTTIITIEVLNWALDGYFFPEPIFSYQERLDALVAMWVFSQDVSSPLARALAVQEVPYKADTSSEIPLDFAAIFFDIVNSMKFFINQISTELISAAQCGAEVIADEGVFMLPKATSAPNFEFMVQDEILFWCYALSYGEVPWLFGRFYFSLGGSPKWAVLLDFSSKLTLFLDRKYGLRLLRFIAKNDCFRFRQYITHVEELFGRKVTYRSRKSHYFPMISANAVFMFERPKSRMFANRWHDHIIAIENNVRNLSFWCFLNYRNMLSPVFYVVTDGMVVKNDLYFIYSLLDYAYNRSFLFRDKFLAFSLWWFSFYTDEYFVKQLL